MGLGDALGSDGIGRTRSELPKDDDDRDENDRELKERELKERAAWALEYQSPIQQIDTKTAKEKFRSLIGPPMHGLCFQFSQVDHDLIHRFAELCQGVFLFG